MTGEIVTIVLGSAVLGAAVSSIITSLFGHWAKRQELHRQDLDLALKLTELKHRQVIQLGDWAGKDGRPFHATFFDPLVTVFRYRSGIEEFRRTGRWSEAEESMADWEARQRKAKREPPAS